MKENRRTEQESKKQNKKRMRLKRNIRKPVQNSYIKYYEITM